MLGAIALAGLAGLTLMGNPPKRRRSRRKSVRRRNPPYRYLSGKTCVSPSSGLTYKVRFDTDYREWQVAAFKDGKFVEGPTVYVSDKTEALDTLAAFAQGKDMAAKSNPRRRRISPSVAGQRLAFRRWRGNPGSPALAALAKKALAGIDRCMKRGDTPAAGLRWLTDWRHANAAKLRAAGCAEPHRFDPWAYERSNPLRKPDYQLADGTQVTRAALRRMFFGKIPGPTYRRILGIRKLPKTR